MTTTTTTTDELREALAARAARLPAPEPTPVAELRQRVLTARLRRVTAVAAAVLLLAGLVTVLRPPGSSSTLDTRLGGRQDATTTTETTAPTSVPDETAGRVGAPAGGGAPASARGDATSTTTTLVPGSAGPIDVAQSPPTTRGPTEPTFAVAQPGDWNYRVVYESGSSRRDALGRSTDASGSWAEAYLTVRPPEGRKQTTVGRSFAFMTVQGAVRTLADAVDLHELTLWDGRSDSARTFRLPAGAFEVPPGAERGRAWTYEATSTDGTTRMRVRSEVTDEDDVVWLDDGQSTSVDAVRVSTVIDVSGERTAHLERTVWWATDLGVAAKIHEVESGTATDGATYRRTGTATLRQPTPYPESLNRQVAPDEDGDGVPDSADRPS
jgi:hypothetical protein